MRRNIFIQAWGLVKKLGYSLSAALKKAWAKAKAGAAEVVTKVRNVMNQGIFAEELEKDITLKDLIEVRIQALKNAIMEVNGDYWAIEELDKEIRDIREFYKEVLA